MSSKAPRYRLEAPLGKGGMGEVYKAYDTLLHRPVALKILRHDKDDDASGRAERLLREARACAALRHPNIVTIHDVGEENDNAFIAMELLDGVPLTEYVCARAVPMEKKLAWLRDVARALDF